MHGRARGEERKSGPEMDGWREGKDTPTQGDGGGDVDEVKGPSATFQGRARCWRCAVALAQLQEAPRQLMSLPDQGRP